MTADAVSKVPVGVAVDGAGNVYVLDANTSQIEKFTPSGELIARWGFASPGEMQPDRSVGVSVDGAGNVYMLHADTCRIQKYAPSGAFIGAWGFGASGEISAGEPVVDVTASVPARVETPVAPPKEAAAPTAPSAPAVETKKPAVAAPAVDTVKAVASSAAAAAAPVTDSVEKGLGKLKTDASVAVGAPGDGPKSPGKTGVATPAKRPWWQFWK